MMRTLLVRGLLAGLLAAAGAVVVAGLLGEPQVRAAIALEDAANRLAGTSGGPELVSRAVQQTLGLAVAVGLFGVALGGLFAVAFAVAYGRLGALGARATAALVALGGFGALTGVPFLKYPPNPPAASDPATIGYRTMLYVLLLALGVLAGLAAVLVSRAAAARLGGWNAALLGAAVFLTLIIVAYLVLPGVDEVPPGFPVGIVWRFRLASLAVQATTWAGLGLAFGVLAERVLEPARHRPPQATGGGAGVRHHT